MLQVYRNVDVSLGEFRVTGASGDSFVLSNQNFLCDSVKVDLNSNIEPSYKNGERYAEDYLATDYVRGSLSLDYYLTGQNIIFDLLDDNDSRISGNIGGLFFKEGKISSLSINSAPNEPIRASLTIDFFDQLSGTLTPSTSSAESQNISNSYNTVLTNNSTDVLGGINLLNFAFDVNNEITPVQHDGKTIPDSLYVGRKESRFNATVDVVSGVLPVSGNKVNLSLAVKDFGGNTIYTIPVSGYLQQRNISTSLNDIVKSEISIVSTRVSVTPSVLSIGSTDGIYFVEGTNLDNVNTVCVGDICLERGQDNLTDAQLTGISATNDDDEGFFTVRDDGNIYFVPPNNVGSGDITVYSNAGSSTSASGINSPGGEIFVSGMFTNPSDLESQIFITGSGFYRVSHIYFGALETTNFSRINSNLISVKVPKEAGSGLITVKSNDKSLSGVSSSGFYPNPLITGASLYTGITGQEISVLGFGLNHVTGAEIGSGVAVAVSSASTNSVTVNVGATSKTGPIVLRGGLGSSGISPFHFTTIPLITGINPSPANIGDAVSILGQGLSSHLLYSPNADDRYLVQFQGSSASGLFKIVSDTEITGLIPNGALSGKVQLYKDVSKFHYSAADFNLTLQAPQITGVTPLSGRDNYFTLKGNNLENVTGVSIVSNKTSARYEVTGDGYFKLFNVPPDQSYIRLKDLSYFSLDEGQQDIILKYQYGETTGSGVGTGIYYRTNPTITNISLSSGVTGQNITIQGTGFYSDSSNFYFQNDTSEAYLLQARSSVSFIDDKNTGVSLSITDGLNFLFDSFIGNFVTGKISVKNNYGSYTGNNFNLIAPPHISGFEPLSGQIGDTITVSGAGFINVSDVKINNSSVSSFTVTDAHELTFDIHDGATNGLVSIVATGGPVSSVDFGILRVIDGPITISGFIPQPAFLEYDVITITGQNLNSATDLYLSGVGGNEITLSKSFLSASTTGFITGNNGTSGDYIQFKAPSITQNNQPIILENNDGRFQSSSNLSLKSIDNVLGFSGFSGYYPEPFTGILGDELIASGEGFITTSAVLFFVSGQDDTTKGQVLISGLNQTRLSDWNIKLTAPSGIDSSKPVYISGNYLGKEIFKSSDEFNLLPTIKGFTGSSFQVGAWYRITGYNTASIPSHISGNANPTLDDVELMKDPNGLDPSLGYYPTDVKIGISGLSSDGLKTVEYISKEVSGFQNADNGNLSFLFKVASNFIGTGQLFLVDPSDTFAIFSGDEDNSKISLFSEATGFSQSKTSSRLSDLIFAQEVSIVERSPIISGFAPLQGEAGTSITVSGQYFEGITGVIIFSGSTESAAVSSFSARDESNITFSAPSFTEASGRFRLLTDNYTIESTNDATGNFKYLGSAAGASLTPTGAVAGDTVTINASAGLLDTEEVRLVSLNGVTATGSFSIVDDTQVTFIVPSEGILTADQIVDVQTYNGSSTTSIGDLHVFEGSKTVLGDVLVSGILTVTGSGFFETGTFSNRPSVNGSGVLLVGEAAGLSDGYTGTRLSVTGSNLLDTGNMQGYGDVTVTLVGDVIRISGGGAAGNPAGGNGEIQFNKEGVFGASPYFVVQTGINTRVGIGNSAPVYELDISGTIAADSFVFNAGTITDLTVTKDTIESGIIKNIRYTHTTNVSAASQVIDFDSNSLISITMNQDSNFSTANRGAGKTVTVRLLAGGANRSLTFDSNIVFVGDKPTGLLAGKIGILNFTSFGSNESDTVAAYEGQI